MRSMGSLDASTVCPSAVSRWAKHPRQSTPESGRHDATTKVGAMVGVFGPGAPRIARRCNTEGAESRLQQR